ncbi:MAG: methionyl-tRNA formyltransferase [Ruminococcaceae bacterium]|nr:methionyl-tRNA formyltransferase [Oscillospiraceae bacterium]
MRILFMGTPDFAVFSLRALVEAGMDVVAVVTQPDQPKGRGYVLTPPPVKIFAQEHGIPVYQPVRLKNGEFDETLAEIDPELIVVTAYGKILPKSLLDYPKYGCVNVHGSLLPEYRGAAPMQRAILEGKKETGITTMLMDEGLDTGKMLLQVRVPIEENDNFETIHNKMGEAGAPLLVKTIQGIAEGSIAPVAQDDSKSTYAAKIEKADCKIDFSKPAREVHNRIRALSPVPLAFTHLPDGKLLKVVVSELSAEKWEPAPAGTVISVTGGAITVACGEGTIRLLELIPEGKSRMSAAAFINGRKIAVGDRLGN